VLTVPDERGGTEGMSGCVERLGGTQVSGCGLATESGPKIS